VTETTYKIWFPDLAGTCKPARALQEVRLKFFAEEHSLSFPPAILLDQCVIDRGHLELN